MKESYFQKYYSISFKEAQAFVAKYITNIDDFSNHPGGATYVTLLKQMEYIANLDDATTLSKMYNATIYRYTSSEMINVDTQLKQLYGSSYVTKLDSTSAKIQKLINDDKKIIKYNGIDVTIVEMKEDFSFLVYSSDTGFVEDKVLINNSYIDSWNYVSDADAHLLATSYICQENIGSAPVINTGVLYAFTDVDPKSIAAMAPYDVDSNIREYGFSAGNKQIYISADNMPKNTVRVYNEIAIDRSSVKPNCIIIYNDSSEKLIENAIKAASEWNVPIVRIDKMELAKKQMLKIEDMLNDFVQTKNFNSLREAIDLYESNVSGYKLNTIESVTSSNDFMTNIFDSKKIINVIESYINYLKNNGDDNSCKELRKILNDTKLKYDIATKNGTDFIQKTNSLLDIDSLIKIIDDISK